MVAYSYNPETQNVKAGESGVEAIPKLHSEFKANLSSIKDSF